MFSFHLHNHSFSVARVTSGGSRNLKKIHEKINKVNSFEIIPTVIWRKCTLKYLFQIFFTAATALLHAKGSQKSLDNNFNSLTTLVLITAIEHFFTL